MIGFAPIALPDPTLPLDQQPLGKLAPIWLPFLPRIAARSIETAEELLDLVVNGHMQIGVVWDDEAHKALALIGIQTRKAGTELIGEVHWAAGFGRKDWQHLLPQLEQYLKQHFHCTIIKPICRPGWKPLLKTHGYKQTHVMMEKRL